MNHQELQEPGNTANSRFQSLIQPLNKLHHKTLSRALKHMDKDSYFKHDNYKDRYCAIDTKTLKFFFLGDQLAKGYFNQINRSNKIHKWSVGETLVINYHKTGISNETLKLLKGFLKNNFANMKRLSLVFYDCFSVTDQGMEHLGQIARYSPKLKSLHLDLTGMVRMTRKGLERMGYEISRQIHHLESLSITFQCPDEMEDNEVEMLFSSMGKYFSTLKRLKLEFLDVGEIKEETFDFLAEILSRNFKGLEKFTLNLYWEPGENYEDFLAQIPGKFSFIPKVVFNGRCDAFIRNMIEKFSLVQKIVVKRLFLK